MDSIREQMDLTNEISDAISNPVGMGNDIDEVSAALLSRGTSSGPLTGPVSSRTSSRTSSRSWSRRSSTSASSAPTTCRCTRRHTCRLPGRAAWSRAGSRPSWRTTTTRSCVRCRLSWRCKVVQYTHQHVCRCAREHHNPSTMLTCRRSSLPFRRSSLAFSSAYGTQTPSLAVSRVARPSPASLDVPSTPGLLPLHSLSRRPARPGLSRYVHHTPPILFPSLSTAAALLENITPSRRSCSERGRRRG